ncbi:MAG: PhzF family phenazine biosynthesis protein [Calditrichaeota bacterium]|nr:PhzF family phenazine biosynthesis protein [Calditrichota bacterium]
MRILKVQLYDSFSETAFGGNVAGVVFEPPDNNNMDDQVRQSIAKELAAPTTGFLRHLELNRYSLRFFSPSAEMNMCGHVIVGAFAAALDEGMVELNTSGFAEAVAVTAAGEIPVRVSRDPCGLPRVEMMQRLPLFESFELNWRKFAGFIGLREEQLNKDLPMGIASTGLRHLFVGVKTVDTLSKMTLNNEALFSFSKNAGVDTIGVYALYSGQNNPTLRLRDLCHGVGNPEESASGTTNGALACHLTNAGVLSADNLGEVNVLAEMGVEMGRPSLVRTKLKVNDQGEIRAVQVGGCAFKTLSGKFYY